MNTADITGSAAQGTSLLQVRGSTVPAGRHKATLGTAQRHLSLSPYRQINLKATRRIRDHRVTQTVV